MVKCVERTCDAVHKGVKMAPHIVGSPGLGIRIGRPCRDTTRSLEPERSASS